MLNITEYTGSFVSISNIKNYNWCNDFYEFIKQNSPNNLMFNEIDEIVFADHMNMVNQALSKISTIKQGEFYNEMSQYLSNIVLFSSNNITGWTSEKLHGSIFIRIIDEKLQLAPFFPEMSSNERHNPLLYYVEQIIHETSHLYLNMLLLQDKIFYPSNKLHISPIRKDKRPLLGIIHATFVLARVIYAFENLHDLTNIEEQAKQIRLKPLRIALDSGVDVIKNEAKLTANGVLLFNDVYNLSSGNI